MHLLSNWRRRCAAWRALALAAAALGLSPAGAQPADPGSTNRVEFTGCPSIVTGPGVLAFGVCEAGGNASNRTAGEAINGDGRLQAHLEARVSFYALDREVQARSLWRDTLIYQGGAVPDRVVLSFGLDGTLATVIERGTISPAGVEQGVATARLTAAAVPQPNWAGGGATTAVDAELRRDTEGTHEAIVVRQAELVLELDDLVADALLDVEWALETTASALNDWTRDGAGSVRTSADFGAGLLAVRWLDASGRDLGDAVRWSWRYRAADPPVDPPALPLPGSAALLALGLLQVMGVRRGVARVFRTAGLLAVVGIGAAASASATVPHVTYCAPQGRAQQLDLHLPDAVRHPGARPLAVYVHGGGWTSGSRADARARPEVDELLDRGYVVATVSYRLAPAHPFPAALDDVRCAVRFLRAQASRWSIDPLRVVAWGTSAGGHIAALLAHTRPEDGLGSAPTEWVGLSHQVRAVALLYAPLDLPTLYAGAPVSAWGPIFGNDPSALARYSPVAYVRAGGVPTLLVHGGRDTVVPATQSLTMLQRLQQADVPAGLQLVARANHSFDLSGGAAIYPGRGDIARQVGRFFDVETQAPGDLGRGVPPGDAACVAEWLPTHRGVDFNGAHAGLQSRPGASGPLTLRSWSGSQTWWATDGVLTWVGGGRYGAGQLDEPFAAQLTQARAAGCGLDARR